VKAGDAKPWVYGSSHYYDCQVTGVIRNQAARGNEQFFVGRFDQNMEIKMFRKYHRFFIVVVVVLLALGSTLTAYAAGKPSKSYASGIFYVSASNGSDGNDGSLASPWRTIQKAADDMPSGGSVNVLEGNYPERVTVSRCRENSGPIIKNCRRRLLGKHYRWKNDKTTQQQYAYRGVFHLFFSFLKVSC